MMFSDLLVIEFNARSRDLILLHRENKIMIEASVTELEEARLTFSIFLVIPSTKESRLSDDRWQLEKSTSFNPVQIFTIMSMCFSVTNVFSLQASEFSG